MLTYEGINEKLESFIPEVNNESKDIKEFYGNKKIPSHIFYAEALNPLIIKLLSKNTIDVLINKVFQFLEDMANSKDEEVRNLLQVTVLEYLWDDSEILSKAEKLMGKQTKLINQEISKYLKRPS